MDYESLIIVVAFFAIAAWVYSSGKKRDAEHEAEIAEQQRRWIEADRVSRAKWALDHPGEIYPADVPLPDEEECS